MRPTREEVESAILELQSAMLESFEADEAVENAKLKKIKAHKRLLLAREEIRAIQFN